MRHITYEEIRDASIALRTKLLPYSEATHRGTANVRPIRLYGVPRGGVPAALAFMNAVKAFGLPCFDITTDLDEADIIFDDLIDSGATMLRYHQLSHGRQPFAALFWKVGNVTNLSPLSTGTHLAPNEWVIFPWEGDEVKSADDIPTRLLQFIGEDPKRGGLRETPTRFLKAWKEWTSGYGIDPASVLKTFEDGAEGYDEMILVKDIPFYSKCEHHLADIFGVAHIGYVPDGKIVGLSKLSRLVDIFARRLQVQERATNQIADALQEHLAPVGIGVVLECRHACMESRGINRAGTTTLTSAMRGALMSKPEARAEFFALIGRNGHHG
jgi:GTP cyclohydrolase I